MASFLVGLLLAAPDARAGTYVWQTNNADGTISQSPTYSGGTVSAVGTPVNDPAPIFSAGSGFYSTSADVRAENGSTTTSASCSVTISGTLTATFT